MQHDSTLLHPRENSSTEAPGRRFQNVPNSTTNNTNHDWMLSGGQVRMVHRCACICDVCTCVSMHVEVRGHPQVSFLRSGSPCSWNRLSLFGPELAKQPHWLTSEPQGAILCSQGRTWMWAPPCTVYFSMGSRSPTRVLMLTKWVLSPPGPQRFSIGNG